MEFMLGSDTYVAGSKSAILKSYTKPLRDVPAISAGSTNHGIYNTGCNIYQGISSMLDSYCNAGERDADRIKMVADALADLDNSMRNDMTADFSGSGVFLK